MTVHDHLLTAEAHLLMAEERQACEPPNPLRSDDITHSREWLERAIEAGKAAAATETVDSKQTHWHD